MIIEKENIDTLIFSDAKLATKEMESVTKKLFDAMMLGNIEHYKVKIAFNTLDGIKEIFTTIWATTDRFIVLKGGRYIPINAILAVD